MCLYMRTHTHTHNPHPQPTHIHTCALTCAPTYTIQEACTLHSSCRQLHLHGVRVPHPEPKLRLHQRGQGPTTHPHPAGNEEGSYPFILRIKCVPELCGGRAGELHGHQHIWRNVPSGMLEGLTNQNSVLKWVTQKGI